MAEGVMDGAEASLLQTGSPDVVAVGRLAAGPRGLAGGLVATARQIADRIRTRELAHDPAFAQAAEPAGLVFVFRYGVVVTLSAQAGGPATQAVDALDAALAAHCDAPLAVPEIEAAAIAVRGGEDRIDADGLIVLADASAERLELVATVLSRSVVLAHDEMLVGQAFDRSAPLVSELRSAGRVTLPVAEVMKMVGDALAARHRVLGAAQVDERPDLLWDHPALDRLYLRLEGEYELSERAEVLDDKLEALGDFAEVLLDVVQHKRSLRLEWMIIGLIAFEIALTLHEKVFG